MPIYIKTIIIIPPSGNTYGEVNHRDSQNDFNRPFGLQYKFA